MNEKIQHFLEDEAMYNAVQRLLLQEFDLNVVVKDETPQADLIEMVKARIDGRKLLLKGFREMEKYRKGKIKETESNPAV